MKINRFCIVTHKVKPIEKLIRIDYKKNTKKIKIGQGDGRGCYISIHLSDDQINNIYFKRVFNKVFRKKFNKDIYDEITKKIRSFNGQKK
ncbi:MAG: YlxR family protein [Mollicutes bacterium PWAP]|nr:YlxR family protein [Mollicutes bacterium PWAP]